MTGDRLGRRVLLVGAHLDGQWVDVREGAFSHRVHKPMEIEFSTDPKQTTIPVPEFVDYHLERVPIAIRTARADVWIGVAQDLRGLERDQAIVRALFQRDIAQLFQEST
ncbi:hypothetical protein ACKI14_02785 [Streptomyces turgidiscabies]|uniref:hypothetical protein n=1 Tax=Streptomyces turgidiscabies TaxID=85558 RepID=UPI0038F6C106